MCCGATALLVGCAFLKGCDKSGGAVRGSRDAALVALPAALALTRAVPRQPLTSSLTRSCHCLLAHSRYSSHCAQPPCRPFFFSARQCPLRPVLINQCDCMLLDPALERIGLGYHRRPQRLVCFIDSPRKHASATVLRRYTFAGAVAFALSPPKPVMAISHTSYKG